MKILITGGNGYLGTRVVKRLVKEGNDVILLIKNGSSTKMFENLQNIEIYSSSKEDIEKAFENGIDLVLHMATLYGRNGENTEEIVQANLMFPMQVLECAIKNNVKYFLNTDTSIQKLINEYTVTKKQFKEWGIYSGEQEKIRFINMKMEHFYGPFDSEVKFIGGMLKKFKNNVPHIETTKGEQERAFIYIDDLIEAILCIIKYETKNEKFEFVEYEIGPDYNIKVKDVLNIIKRLTNSTSEIDFGAIPYRKNEEMESNCNNSKLKSIGWKQKVLTFEEGIKKILEEENN